MNRPLLIAFGLATACCVPIMAPLISPRHLAVYHLQGSPASLFLPVSIYCGCFWLLFAAVLRLGQRFEGVRLAFWAFVVGLLPWFAVKSLATLAGKSASSEWNVALLAIALCTVFLTAALNRSQSAKLRAGMHALETLFSLASVPGVLLLAQLLWCYEAARNAPAVHDLRSHVSPVATASRRGPRVIWILLDELSYDQVYGRRFPGLALPEFDRLASESTMFTHVVPAGIYTEKILPSLITGLRVRNISASADGRRLNLETTLAPRERAFNQYDSVFSDALEAGYRTGVVGWYNPYCRILSGVLDRCVWVPHHDTLPGGFRTDVGLQRALKAPLLSAFRFCRRITNTGGPSAWTDQKAMDDHINEYRDLAGDADTMLGDPSIDFLLLHMAAPHPEGIYDRHTGQITDRGNSSYIDNLALADKLLGHLEEELKQRGEWDSSAVVVMGDHSWRTQELWIHKPGWSAEDQAASRGGEFDNRPGYLVKLPGQQVGTRIDRPFDAVQTRTLLDNIISNRILTVAELDRWLAQSTS